MSETHACLAGCTDDGAKRNGQAPNGHNQQGVATPTAVTPTNVHAAGCPCAAVPQQRSPPFPLGLACTKMCSLDAAPGAPLRASSYSSNMSCGHREAAPCHATGIKKKRWYALQSRISAGFGVRAGNADIMVQTGRNT